MYTPSWEGALQQPPLCVLTSKEQLHVKTIGGVVDCFLVVECLTYMNVIERKEGVSHFLTSANGVALFTGFAIHAQTLPSV